MFVNSFGEKIFAAKVLKNITKRPGEKAEFTLGFGDHATTFGANPVCCAGAISVISRMDKNFLQEVKEKAEIIKEMLSISLNYT